MGFYLIFQIAPKKATFDYKRIFLFGKYKYIFIYASEKIWHTCFLSEQQYPNSDPWTIRQIQESNYLMTSIVVRYLDWGQ